MSLLSSAARLHKPKFLVACVLSCLLIVFGRGALIHWRLDRADEIQRTSFVELESMQRQANAAQLKADELPSYPLPGQLKVALNQPGGFRLFSSVSSIPGSVRLAFAKAAQEATFSMADPNGRWEATDVMGDPALPRRRLAAVAVSADLWLLFYEHGGFGKSFNVAVIRQSHDRAEATWHAYVAPDVATPADLGKALREKRYREAPFF